jgi:putative ATP-dependent endonuclease of the OLD family
MYIRRIDISNFRGIAKGTFHLLPQCVIIGPNGCGKSTLVDAIALALGRGRIVKALTEHDFTGSNPGPEDRFRIVVSLCGFRDNDHSRNTDWFREGRAIPKWIDSAGTVHASSGPDRVLAAQIAVVGHFDHEELTVEMKRYFYDADDADADDPFLSDSHIEEVPAQLFNQAGLFVLLARRTWEGVVSFNSDLFRRTLLEAAGFPSAEVIHQRDALREPEKPIEASSALGKLVSSINERLGKLLPSAPGLRLRLTAGDSDSVLHALQPHYASESACLPVSRHGVGLLSLQSFLLLLEVATSRKSKNKSVVLALEEPELHLAPGLSTRLVVESRSTADQVICTTHSPRVASLFAANQVLVMTTAAGGPEMRPLARDALSIDASNVDRKLYNQNRARLIEAVMQPIVLVPEGRFDCEWLNRFAQIGEDDQALTPFGAVFGIAPTEDAAVVRTSEAVLSVRRGVVALVDGDAAGDDYVESLQKLAEPPANTIQWPPGYTIEDMVGWILAGDEGVVLPVLQTELSSQWTFLTLAEFVTLLKTKNRGDTKGIKEDVVVHDLVINVIHENEKCRKRCSSILDALVAVATEVDNDLIAQPEQESRLRRFKVI